MQCNLNLVKCERKLLQPFYLVKKKLKMMHICINCSDIASQFFNLVPLNSSRHEHQYVEIVDTFTRFDPLKPIMMQFHWKLCIFALTQTIWIISLTRSLGPKPCPPNLLTSGMMQYLDNLLTYLREIQVSTKSTNVMQWQCQTSQVSSVDRCKS